jgi:23S rRNA G2445 N2-methylase RlmL
VPDPTSLRDRVADPGFTPGRADLPAVVELLGAADEAAVRDAERALLRAGPAAVPPLRERLGAAPPRLRARVVRTLGRLAAEPSVPPLLLAGLGDPDPRTRRAAISALGRLGDPSHAPALLAQARRETDPALLRSCVEALGKSGDAAAQAWLDALDHPDPELQRLRARARLMLGRSLDRPHAAAELDDDATLPAPRPLVATCRPGLEPVLAEELDPAWAPQPAGPGRVRLRSAGPLTALGRARTLLTLGFPLAEAPLAGPEALVDALVAALAGPEAQEVFRTWSKGQVRYRLAWARGGHRRAVVWRVAGALARACPDVVNDPTASPWEVVVDDHGGRLRVELRPRWRDERFAYRRGDVPAASHPTLAAALARVGGARPDDVVWDPFVGSGLELAERGLLGGYARLHGSDLDPRALAVAADNLAGAGLARTELTQADATTHDPGGVTLIVTNPPMGRRVHRGDVGPLLQAFVRHAAAVLQPGGRLAWISPLPRVTEACARAVGLRCARDHVVDMGGFTGRLELWTKRRG